LQVGQNAERTVDDFLGLADRGVNGRVGLVRAVAEVQAKDVRPGAGQGELEAGPMVATMRERRARIMPSLLPVGSA
jgi:hypothetical protein